MDKRKVIDFPITELEQVDEGDPEPAGPEELSQLRVLAGFILDKVEAVQQSAEHIVNIGQNLHLQLVPNSDSFGVHAKDPDEIARRAPLINSGLYLFMPRSDRERNEAFVVGFANNPVSRRSACKLLELFTKFLEPEQQDVQQEEIAEQNTAVSV